MAIGPVIRRRREEMNLSQGRLAELAGLSQGYLSKIEKGSVRSPGLQSVYSLATVLEIDPGHLLNEAGYPSPGRLQHYAAGAGDLLLPAWTSWQSLPACLSHHRGWVCEACRHWPHRYGFNLAARLSA